MPRLRSMLRERRGTCLRPNAPAADDMEVDKPEEEFDEEETLSVFGSIKGAAGTSSMRARQ